MLLLLYQDPCLNWPIVLWDQKSFHLYLTFLWLFSFVLLLELIVLFVPFHFQITFFRLIVSNIQLLSSFSIQSFLVYSSMMHTLWTCFPSLLNLHFYFSKLLWDAKFLHFCFWRCLWFVRLDPSFVVWRLTYLASILLGTTDYFEE